MLNNKLIEKWFDSNFNPEGFYNNFSALQSQLVENYKFFSNLAEENNNKVKNYWESQANLFNANVLAEKIEQIQKLSEENFNKIKSYVEENTKSFKKEEIISEMKKITKLLDDNNQKVLKIFNNNASMINSNAVWEQFDKVNKITEENKSKALVYFNEQYELLKNLQAELIASMKTEDPTKSFPEAVKKYSKSIANANLNKLQEGLQEVKKVVV